MTVRKAFVKDAMTSWIRLNEQISKFTEEEVLHALELENERGDERRETFVERLQQRLRGIKIGEIQKELR